MGKKIGYIGLGKMGKGMVLRLLEHSWCVVAYNRSQESVKEVESAGAIGVTSIKEVVEKLETPRLVWLMVPHKAVDSVLEELVSLLEDGDIVIDGGNSNYRQSVRRARELKEKNINFFDAGVSGGPGGARNGACTMIGGEKELFKKYEELFRDISAPSAYAYMGKAGAGHFVKMVHNGIEYGMMQAIGEGFEVLKKSEFDLDLKEVARIYNSRSVIESRLTNWLVGAYEKYGEDLNDISGSVSASGEGLWTVETARELGVPVPVIEGALRFREESQKHPSYTGQVVSALRNQFGGHEVKKATMMRIGNLNVIEEKTPGRAAKYLAKDLSAYLAERKSRGGSTLFLSSGGSALAVLDLLPEDILGSYLTVGVVDERYDETNENNNFTQLSRTNFYKRAFQAGAGFIDTSVKEDQTQEELADSFEEELRGWVGKNPNGKIVATMGVGADGHTSGIMPFSEDKDRFAELFEGSRWVVAYDAGAKNPFSQRITTTMTFLRKLDKIFVFMVGANKKTAFLQMQKSGQIAETPARVLKQLNGNIYIDENLLKG